MRSSSSYTELLVLGVIFHALYVLSIFDIYFKSPVVVNIPSVVYTDTSFSPPAQRLVVFVADGCRADKFFEANATTTSENVEAERRVSFLRRVAEEQGSWGVSHTRVPTESRPGHVALFAGMYEDVSAVTKGWQDNPVDFDSIFNQSTHSWLFGSPDIVPMFARNVPHATEWHYSHEEEDFATDASQLDVWVYEQFAGLLARAEQNATLREQLHRGQVLFFCHFLGIDSNGHAHRPHSADYLNNIALVDELVEKIYRLVEDFYDYDGKTAYVFSADHGMSNKGAHGDGDPANTRTPLVVWGAGVDAPTRNDKNGGETSTAAKVFQIDLPTQSKAQVEAQLQAQIAQEQLATVEWGSLIDLVRKDVMQADVAPLISSLLGLPYPRNSVGVLPFTYLAKGKYRAKAVMSNALQLYQHARRKEQEKEAQTLFFFQPFRTFRQHAPLVLEQLQTFWDSDNTQQVETLSQELIEICLAALEYFQRYDWFFLLSLIVVGYLGWMALITIAYLHPSCFHIKALVSPRDGKLWFLIFSVFTYFLLENSPVTYYLYVSFPIIFWNFVWNHRQLLMHEAEGQATTCSAESKQRWIEGVLILLCLELVVLGYERRFIFGIVFTLLALWPFVEAIVSPGEEENKQRHSKPATLYCWTASCLSISVFPYLPTEYGEHTLLVLLGGLLILVFGAIMLRLVVDEHIHSSSKLGRWIVVFTPLILSLVALHLTMENLAQKNKPPVWLTVSNWVLAIAPIVALVIRLSTKALLPTQEITTRAWDNADPNARLNSEMWLHAKLERLVEVMFTFAPSFVLLSISYEVFFYIALCAVLFSWVVLEAEQQQQSASSISQEIRRAFFFLLLIKIAFFGTGNVASMSSFEISSTYRFVTIFSPFLMGALLVIKILIPFMVVACAFHVVLSLSTTPHPPSRYFLLVVGMSDVLALHFLFLVKNEGSWKEIGNSISMFGIVNAQIVFIPLLFLLARAFVQDLHRHTTASDSKKLQ